MSRLNQIQQMLKDSPDDPFLRFALAQEYQRNKEHHKALECFEELVELQPGYTGTYYHLGKLYEVFNRPDDAVNTYKKGIDICRKAGATHDQSELQGALLELED